MTAVLVGIIPISLALLFVGFVPRTYCPNAEVFKNETIYSVEPNEGLLSGPSKQK